MRVTNAEDLQNKVRNFGKLLIDKAELYAGNDTKIVSISISCEISVEYNMPIITVSRIYNAPEIVIPDLRENAKNE